jgi:TolA-binding protein
MSRPLALPAFVVVLAGAAAAQDHPANARAINESSLSAVVDDDTAKARYEALSEAVKEFEREAKETRDEVRLIGARRYQERRKKIEGSYHRAMDPVVLAERSKRLDAIAAFEAFLLRHPDDREFTPDAVFRLAELYFERYDDDYQLALEDFKDRYQRWVNDGSKGKPPVEPAKHFEKTIALYERLIANYPDYRLLDGAYYLLGFAQRTQGLIEEGLATWLALVDRFPQSRFCTEVWFRIGDQHFDDESWDEAVAAFLKVVPMKESDFYDKALYKLAWTYYLINRFDESVARFFELLDFSAARKDQGSGSVLEEESIQYVAISFGDDNWRRPKYARLVAGKSLTDPDAEIAVDYVSFARDTFERAGPRKPYQRDVFARMGQNLFKQAKLGQAVTALEEAIKLDPWHRDAPKLQDIIVQAWVRERRFDRANAARELLVKTYADGTPWAKRFADDAEARQAAEDFARTNQYSAALSYHQQATQYFNDDQKDLGVEYFRAASDAYTSYLQRYPHDKNAYELGYYLAETLYYSLRFEEAVAAYQRTRDSPAGTKYQAEAGLNVVYAYEKIIDAQVAAGKLESKEAFSGRRPEHRGVPQPLPPLRAAYLGAIDKFLARSTQHEMAPAFGYRAGEMLYAYGHTDDAIQRFRFVVVTFPRSEAAKFAANLILDDLLAKKDWATAAEYAEELEQGKIGGETEAFRKIKAGAQFNIATNALDQGRKLREQGRIAEGNALLENGAEQYLKLVDVDPQREFADKMVYNAALSLETARRPLRAAALYERLYQEYPKSEHAPEAMFRVAAKNEQAFNFDKSVATYLGLVRAYPKSERCADAQVNAALELEGQQKYQRAAHEFERFATLFPDRPEAPDVFYRAAVVHKKRQTPWAELDVLSRFVSRYQGRAEHAAKVIEAHARTGELYEELQKTATGLERIKLRNSANESHRAAVRGFDGARASPAAALHAAKSAFALAEQSFAAFSRLGIVAKNSELQLRELTAKSERLTKVESEFKDIITKYKVAEWSLAALFRIGALYDNVQQTVLQSPCPDDVRRIADDIACDEYRNAIEDRANAVEGKAIDAYQTAYAKAQELRISNQWTKRTLEALNVLRPNDYPIDKEPLTRPADAALAVIGPVLPDGGAGEVAAAGPGPAELALKAGDGP